MPEDVRCRGSWRVAHEDRHPDRRRDRRGYVAGTRLGEDFAQLPVTDHSLAALAPRLMDRITTEHGPSRDVLLKAMLDRSHPGHARRRFAPTGRRVRIRRRQIAHGARCAARRDDAALPGRSSVRAAARRRQRPACRDRRSPRPWKRDAAEGRRRVWATARSRPALVVVRSSPASRSGCSGSPASVSPGPPGPTCCAGAVTRPRSARDPVAPSRSPGSSGGPAAVSSDAMTRGSSTETASGPHGLSGTRCSC